MSGSRDRLKPGVESQTTAEVDLLAESRMKILFIAAVYPPEREPSGIMARELAEHWVGKGHEVTVLCPYPNRPMGARYRGYTSGWWKEAMENGVRVVRLRSWLVGSRRRLLDRVLEAVTFGLFSGVFQVRFRDVDVVLLESWPLSGQLIGAVVAKVLGVPPINYIKDLYPEALVSAGVTSLRSRFARTLFFLDSWVCKICVRNILISESMMDECATNRGLPVDVFDVVNDWLDLSEFSPVISSKWRKSVGLQEDVFLCMFAGSMGHASGVDILVEVASKLSNLKGISIVCVGDGVLKETMVSDAKSRGLKNLYFVPFQLRNLVPEMQSSADAFLLTSSASLGSSSVPNKFITYLAMGKPVICSTGRSSGIGKVVRHSDVGIVTDTGSSDGIAAAVRTLASMPAGERSRLGKRARLLAEQDYSLVTAMEKFDKLLSQFRT